MSTRISGTGLQPATSTNCTSRCTGTPLWSSTMLPRICSPRTKYGPIMLSGAMMQVLLEPNTSVCGELDVNFNWLVLLCEVFAHLANWVPSRRWMYGSGTEKKISLVLSPTLGCHGHAEY